MENVLQLEPGETMSIAGREVVASYGNDGAARAAAEQGVALLNRSHWGLIRVGGGTRRSFLHNLTTNDFNRLQPGEQREAVFLTSTARLIDYVTALATESAIWLITSPERRGTLLGWIPRFVMFTDEIELSDESEEQALFSLIGPRTPALVEALGAPLPEPGHHQRATIEGIGELWLARGGGLLGEGVTLIVPTDAAPALWAALREQGAEPMGQRLWEKLRVEQGRPAPDHEITEEYNPLEAGLWEAIAFDKGCYIGQEVVARLDTYQKLKQQLWGLEVTPDVQPGTPVVVEEKEVGHVTSVAGSRALAYIRTRAGGAGTRVRVGDGESVARDLPFLTRGRSDIGDGG